MNTIANMKYYTQQNKHEALIMRLKVNNIKWGPEWELCNIIWILKNRLDNLSWMLCLLMLQYNKGTPNLGTSPAPSSAQRKRQNCTVYWSQLRRVAKNNKKSGRQAWWRARVTIALSSQPTLTLAEDTLRVASISGHLIKIWSSIQFHHRNLF